MKLFPLLLIGVGALSLVACSSDSSDSPNRAPVLEAVNGPSETTSAGANQSITLEMLWRDDDKDAITSIRYRVAELGINQTTTAQGASAETPGASLTLLIPGQVPKKSYDFLFSAIDARGAESAPVTKNITIK
jgi:hypothetical protein